MKPKTKQAFLRLKELWGAAKANLYERVCLAVAVLDDLDWIAEVHAGDQDRAAEAVGAEYFPDLCGTGNGGLIPLAKLVAIGRMFPAEAIWREYRYDLRAMEILFDERRAAEQGEGPSPAVRRATRRDVEERDQRIRELEFDLRRSRQAQESQESELQRLREQVVALQTENAVLRGRLQELERLLPAHAA